MDCAGILARLTDRDKEDMMKHQFGYVRSVSFSHSCN